MSNSKQASKVSQSPWHIHPSFCELNFDNQTYPIIMETTREEEP